MQVEAVIFDIGNVLIEWQPENFYDGAIGRAAARWGGQTGVGAPNPRLAS